jgi:hypothetical protein
MYKAIRTNKLLIYVPRPIIPATQFTFHFKWLKEFEFPSEAKTDGRKTHRYVSLSTMAQQTIFRKERYSTNLTALDILDVIFVAPNIQVTRPYPRVERMCIPQGIFFS